MLRLLLTCPVFFKSQERFHPPDEEDPRKVLDALEEDDKPSLSGEEDLRYQWLKRLSLPKKVWQELQDLWTPNDEEFSIPGIVPDELCIERVSIDLFSSPPAQRHAIAVEPTIVISREDAKDAKKRITEVRPFQKREPELQKPGDRRNAD